MVSYERGWDEKDGMKKKRVWNQSNHGAQSGPCDAEMIYIGIFQNYSYISIAKS